MQNLEQYARELVNLSFSDDETHQYTSQPLLHTPTRFTTNNLPSIQEQIPLKPKNQSTAKAKATSRSSLSVKSKKKTTKQTKKTVTIPQSSRDKAKEMRNQVEELKKQIQDLEDENDQLRSDKQQLKAENQEQLMILNQIQAKLESCQMNEKKLQAQLSEQMDVTRQALKQASDAQINLEQSKTSYMQSLQLEETQRKLFQEELDSNYRKKLDYNIKQTIQDTTKTYEHKLVNLSREVEGLRLENIELHKRIMSQESNRKHIYVQSEIANLKSKYCQS